MVSYQLISSSRVWGFGTLFWRALASVSRVSVTGALVQRLVMSREARVNWGSMGVSLNFVFKSVVFSRLCVLGSGASCLIFRVNILASLYAGAPRQLTTGRMGCWGLCSSPLMVCAVGLLFTYFHLVSGGMNVLLLFITFRTWDWKEFVGSLAVV